MLYKKRIPTPNSLVINQSYTGEFLETKIQRIVNNKEPIKDGAPLIYTARVDGVKPEYDIRTDKFEIAVEAMGAVTKSHIAKRAGTPTIGEQAKEGMQKEGGDPSIQGTNS